MLRVLVCVLPIVLAPWIRGAERINHAGRILGPAPVVGEAVLFNTPEADAIMAGLQIFPRDHAWNENISRRPLLPNSAAMISKIFSELYAVGTNSPRLRAFKEMNFVLVPDSQPLVAIRFTVYPEESDPGPYPIPANLPIEGWPSETDDLTLAEVQRDAAGDGGDRHAIIIQPGTGFIWETWQTLLQGTAWRAANGARFNLTNLLLRPAGWTSGDAAGLSMLGGVVRFDETERGEIEHALRMIVKHTRRAYIYPATHSASSPSTTDPDVPAMGQRLRLGSDFVVPTNWTKQERAIVAALKRYGGIIADNSSSFFSISIVPDKRWPSGAFSHITGLSVTNFEVIETTGPSEGPRSPGGPEVDAGPDQRVSRGSKATLAGSLRYSGSEAPTLDWKVYSGPGVVTFEDATRTNATASFSALGEYVLMLKADDGIHTPAYDAMVVAVTDSIQLNVQQVDEEVVLQWTGGSPPFELQTSASLPASQWVTVGTFSVSTARVAVGPASAFFRVLGQ